MGAQTLPGEAVSSALAQLVLLLLLIRFLDVWEREPVWLVALLAIWGGIFATSIAAPINDARLAALSPDFAAVWGAAWVAPTDEEPAKGLALLALYLLSRLRARRRGNAEFDGPLDGMVYGAAIGLGFGFIEDLTYGQRYGLGVLHLRLGFLGLLLLGHAVFTASFGAGLGLATWSRTLRARLGFTLLGLGVAMFLHFVHDGLVSVFLTAKYGFHTTAAAIEGQQLPAQLVSQINATVRHALVVLHVFDYGTIVAFFAALAYWIRYQRAVLVQELAEEVSAGVITAAESELVTHYGARLRAYGALALSGQLIGLYRLRRRHRQVTDLAFCKWRISRIGGATAMDLLQRSRIPALRRQLNPAHDAGAASPATADGPGTARPAHLHDRRNSLILGIVGLALGIFLLPLVASVLAVAIGLRTRASASPRSVPPGLVLGILGLVLWVPVYVVAIANSP